MKKKLLFLPLIALFISGCSFKDLMFWKKKDESSQKDDSKDEGKQSGGEEDQGGKEEGGEEQREDIGEQEYTATVLTSGSDFASCFSSGSHFDQKEAELKEYFDDQLEYYDLITSVECSLVDSFKWNGETYMKIGTGSGAGEFVWHSDVKIYKVEATVLCYANYDTYHKVNIYDSWSHAVLSGDDFDLTYDGESDPLPTVISKEFSEGVKSFKLENKDGRIFVKDLKITWRG